MSISYANAKNIELIVQQIDALNGAITNINNATLPGKNPTILDLTLTVQGSAIRIDPQTVQLSASDSATIINAIFGALQTLLATQTTNLANAPVN